MAERANLRVVDPITGEVGLSCAGCQARETEIEGLKHTIGSQSRTIGHFKGRLRQALAEADEAHDAFPAFKRCHDRWKERCKHPRTKYDLEDFKLWLPHFEKYGEAMCLQAIDGAAYDCFVTTRKNGTTKRHDGWELIHRNGEKFREFANKAPIHLPDPNDISILTKAIMFTRGKSLDDDQALHEAVEEAKERLKRR